MALLSGEAGVATWLFLAGSTVLLAATLDVLRRQPTLFMLTLSIGAAGLVVGNAQWTFGRAPSQVVSWWLAFLVLTIVGERLELSRFLPPSAVARHVFALLLVAICTGLAAGEQAWGPPLFGAGLLGLAAWLLKQDIARRTVHGSGLTRFIAICLLSGYAWLAVGAAGWLGGAASAPGSALHDSALHAITLGFVFSMVSPRAISCRGTGSRSLPPTFYCRFVAAGLARRRLAGTPRATRLHPCRRLAQRCRAGAFVLGTLVAVLRGRRKAAEFRSAEAMAPRATARPPLSFRVLRTRACAFPGRRDASRDSSVSY